MHPDEYSSLMDYEPDRDLSRSNVDDAEARIRREAAIAAADRCYQRAMSRIAQIKDAPQSHLELWIKAGEARAAGDDVMRAAGLDPKEHPRAKELMEKGVP